MQLGPTATKSDVNFRAERLFCHLKQCLESKGFVNNHYIAFEYIVQT